MASPGVIGIGARLTGPAALALVTGRGPESRGMDCVGGWTCSAPGIWMPLGLDRLPPRNHEELADEPEAMACGARELRFAAPRSAALRFVAAWVGVPMVGRDSSGMAFLLEGSFVVADRRVVLLDDDDDDDDDLLAAGLLEVLLLLDRVDLEVDGVGVTDGRPGRLRICCLPKRLYGCPPPPTPLPRSCSAICTCRANHSSSSSLLPRPGTYGLPLPPKGTYPGDRRPPLPLPSSAREARCSGP